MNDLSVTVTTDTGEVSFGIPRDYPIPPVGGDFYFNFRSAVSDAGEWEAMRSLLEENVLTVDRVEDAHIVLRSGVSPTFKPVEPEKYLQRYKDYWQLHPSTKPAGF